MRRLLQRKCLWVLASVVLGCAGADVSSPAAAPVAGRIVAYTPDTMSADPDWEVALPPAVRVTDASGSTPVPDLLVRITITGGGSIGAALGITRTDKDGIATVGAWRLSDTAAVNTITMTVPGVGSVTFSARALSRHVIARFELRSIGGIPVPAPVPNGGSIVGGRYVLFDDGSATFGYDIEDGVYGAVPLAYTITGQIGGQARILFILPGPSLGAFYAQYGGLFSTGDCVDGTMSVKYTDFLDFTNEVYALSK